MEKTGLRFLALVTGAFFAAAGCGADLSVPEGAQIGCVSEKDCPAGWTCNANLKRCVQTGKIDQSAPVIAGTPVISPAVITRGATVRASFDASEELESVPEVAIDLRGALRRLTHDASGSHGTHYEFTYAAAGDEPETTCQVFATMLDKGGNRTTGALVGGVMFDFTPPGIATAAVAYGPPPGSAVQTVDRATTGSTISVTVIATELLSAAEPPLLSASNGSTTLAFSVVPGSATAVGAVFRRPFPRARTRARTSRFWRCPTRLATETTMRRLPTRSWK